jgi:hypothetical protein
MTQLTIGLCKNLTDPKAESVIIGHLLLNGDKFEGYKPKETPESLELTGFIAEVMSGLPHYLKMAVVEDWQGYRAEGHWSSAAEFLVDSMHRSSIHVMAVEEVVE